MQTVGAFKDQAYLYEKYIKKDLGVARQNSIGGISGGGDKPGSKGSTLSTNSDEALRSKTNKSAALN